jgi:hypothetical protein
MKGTKKTVVAYFKLLRQDVPAKIEKKHCRNFDVHKISLKRNFAPKSPIFEAQVRTRILDDSINYTFHKLENDVWREGYPPILVSLWPLGTFDFSNHLLSQYLSNF